jgi:hypothetical protein
MRTLHWSSIKFPTTPRSLDALVKVSEFLFFVVQYKTEAYYSKWVGILCLVPTSIWRCLILHFLFILACHVNKIYDYINCYCLNFTPRACTQWYIREQWGRDLINRESACTCKKKNFLCAELRLSSKRSIWSINENLFRGQFSSCIAWGNKHVFILY